MKKLILLLSNVIRQEYQEYHDSVLDLDVLCRFSISENSNRYDYVFLVFDRLSVKYFVIWKWSTSSSYHLRSFNFNSDAYDFYRERHDYACNAINAVL